jgi:putative peptidoglycan lipid II flippase
MVREVGRLMIPRLLGVAIVQLNFVINVIIASGLPEGSISAINYAWQVMTMPQVVIAQAIAIAALPTFSAQIARGDPQGMRGSLAATLRGVVFLSLPASLGLILLREPLITILFKRGSFDAQSVNLVSWALLWYAAGLIGHNVVEILSRAFYAFHDTKTPVFVGTAAMTLNIAFSFTFSFLFSRVGWMPHGGLALANSLATALEMTTLYLFMRNKLKGLEGRNIWRGFIQAALGTLVMSLVVLIWSHFMGSIWIIGLGGVMIGGLCYGISLWVMKVPEFTTALSGIARRLKRDH